MMRFWRWTLIVFAVAALAPALTKAAEDDTAQEVERTARIEDFPQVFEKVAASAETQASYRACPATVWDTARPFWRWIWEGVVGDSDMSDGNCDAAPLTCLSRCLGWKSGNACFQSARTLQEHAERDRHASVQALFAQACALGYPAGCTNRAAGIKNGGYEGDPIPDPEEPNTANCLFRSFEIACREEDPWGCAMHGMSLRYGEGTAADAPKARAAFEKSCAMAPKFAACETAKSQLDEMNAPKEQPDAE